MRGALATARRVMASFRTMGLRSLTVLLAPALVVVAACSSSTTASSPTPSNADAGVDATVARDDVRFVALGDTGKGNAGQKAVAAAMATKCAASGCDFAVLLGDNIYESGISSPDDPEMQSKFEDIYAALDMDFQIVLGNHDYGGQGYGNEFDKAAHEVAYSAKSKKWKLPAPHYRFQKTHVDFFVLDTNLMMYSRDAAQKTDVAGWLAESNAPWKIALGHHPYKSNGPHGNAGTYDGLSDGSTFSGKGVQTFMDDIVCGKVDLYLSAHDHSLQWPTDTCKGTALAVSGAGASPTTLSPKNPTKFETTKLGFLYVTLTKTSLTAEFIDETGASLHTEKLSK